MMFLILDNCCVLKVRLVDSESTDLRVCEG